jgi:hypothetical protein
MYFGLFSTAQNHIKYHTKFGNRLAVGLQFLELLTGVRISVPEPFLTKKINQKINNQNNHILTTIQAIIQIINNITEEV